MNVFIYICQFVYFSIELMSLNDTTAGMEGLDKDKINKIGQRNEWQYQVIEVSVRFSVIICLIMGCLIFCRGYLLNRKVITEKSGSFADQKLNYSTTLYSTPRGFRKIILVLVDALRFDFIHRMKFIAQKLNTSFIDRDSTACPFKFIADPPTTTMQRLKALTTGTFPTFIDVSSNFNRLV